MSTQLAEQLVEQLWSGGSGVDAPEVYAVLDGARDPRIAGMIRFSKLDYECLYRGKLSAKLRDAAPYVVYLGRNARFTAELIDKGWGKSWGFFTRVPADFTLKQHFRHFRKLLRVQDEAGRKLVFRFYDPRVLRTYLPTCEPDELRQFFGSIPNIATEAESPEKLLTYSQKSGGLKVNTVTLSV